MAIDRRAFLGLVGTMGGTGITGCLSSGDGQGQATTGGRGPARTVKMVTQGMPGGHNYFDPIGVFITPGVR